MYGMATIDCMTTNVLNDGTTWENANHLLCVKGTDSYPRTQTLNIGFYSIKEIEFLGYAVFKDLIKIKKN